MKKILYNGRIQSYGCDFCDNKAIYTDTIDNETDTVFLCSNHKNPIVRSGLVNTSETLMPIDFLIQKKGNINQAIKETESDLRTAISMKDKSQQKCIRYKLKRIRQI